MSGKVYICPHCSRELGKTALFCHKREHYDAKHKQWATSPNLKKSIVKQSRAKESNIGRMVRRESDRVCKASSRACESKQERENRVSSDRVTRARKRARETEEQSSMSKVSDRQSKS